MTPAVKQKPPLSRCAALVQAPLSLTGLGTASPGCHLLLSISPGTHPVRPLPCLEPDGHSKKTVRCWRAWPFVFPLLASMFPPPYSCEHLVMSPSSHNVTFDGSLLPLGINAKLCSPSDKVLDCQTHLLRKGTRQAGRRTWEERNGQTCRGR